MSEIAEVPMPSPTPEVVFREYAPRIYHLARRMLGNDADAEDVTSEVLMQVVRKLDTFRGEAQLPTWLHRVTVNAALAYREKRGNRTKHEHGTAEEALEAVAVDPSGRVKLARPNYGATPADIVLADEERELIEEAVAKLPEPFRDVYVLADVEGLPNAEIAEMLKLNLAAVKSRLHRARLRMRDLLAPHYADAEAMELAP
jgi:RNA polymerase sigma-70 factor (ECF subfamily)